MTGRLVELIEKRQRLIDAYTSQLASKKIWIDSSIVFSASNNRLNANVRSYFDRWRDRVDSSGTLFENRHVVPTWHLEVSSSDSHRSVPKSRASASSSPKAHSSTTMTVL